MDNHLNNRVFDFDDKGELAVVICHFNPCAYMNPVRNLGRTLNWLADQGLPTYAAELRCGLTRQTKPVLPKGHPKVTQLQSESVLFQKENLWNVVVNRLPNSFRFVLCLDADVILTGDQWKLRLLKMLETCKVVHPFSQAVWNDSLGRSYRRKFSSLYAYAHGMEFPESGKLFHPGFALACHRDLWNAVGGLYNGIFGEGASCFMSAILGRSNALLPYFDGLSKAVVIDYQAWAKRLCEWVNFNFSCLEGEAEHFWHGSTKHRGYVWDAPVNNPVFLERSKWFQGFHPHLDLRTDPLTGLVTWSPHATAEKPALIEYVESYFTHRNEDEWYDSSNPA